MEKEKVKIKKEVIGAIKINDKRKNHDYWNRVKTKEELLEMLRIYKGILTKPIVEYLNSLIELDFSVIRNYISDDERKVLSELEIYKKIAIYNIYNRALNLFQSENMELNIYGNELRFEGLDVYTGKIHLFKFDYKEIPISISIGYKNINIGEIELYQMIENAELRKAEIERIKTELEKLYKVKNPYRDDPWRIGGYGTDWYYEHLKTVSQYEAILKVLENKTELTEEEKKEIQITKYICDLLLEDYGLTTESFENVSYKPFTNIGDRENRMGKTLVKVMPNLKIKNKITYI